MVVKLDMKWVLKLVVTAEVAAAGGDSRGGGRPKVVVAVVECGAKEEVVTEVAAVEVTAARVNVEVPSEEVEQVVAYGRVPT